MADDDQNKDVLLLHSPTEDGDGVRVVRARQGKVEVGEVRSVTEGKPLSGELVTLKPREGAPRVCDVEVHYTAPAKADVKGPAQVATESYRDNWEATFGGKNKKKKPADALN